MSIKIIVVDDNKLTNRIIQNILKNDFKDKEINVEFFTDGKSGLEYLTDPRNINDYDIIILDGHIKAREEDEEQIDGPLIAEKLKQNHIDKRVIIYTSDDKMAERISLFFDPPPPRLSKQLSRSGLKQVLIDEIQKLEKSNTIDKQMDNLNLEEDKNSNTVTAVSPDLSSVSVTTVR